MGKSLRIGIFTSAKLLDNPLASSSFRNFIFLLLQIAHFDKTIINLFVVLKGFGFLLSVFFYTSNNKITLLYICIVYTFIYR